MKGVHNGSFVSVVVPLFNEEMVIEDMYKKVTGVLGETQLDYEIIMVNDGSRDRTLDIAK